MAARLAQPDARERGWLLDGFPRTEVQAKAMEKLFLLPTKVMAGLRQGAGVTGRDLGLGNLRASGSWVRGASLEKLGWGVGFVCRSGWWVRSGG